MKLGVSYIGRAMLKYLQKILKTEFFEILISCSFFALNLLGCLIAKPLFNAKPYVLNFSRFEVWTYSAICLL